jgi:phosphoserine phosphatase RsbU/P
MLRRRAFGRAWERAASRRSAWLWMALAVDTVIAVVCVLVGQRFNLTWMLAAGPLLACARCSGRTTALVAGYAVALCAIVGAAAGILGTRDGGYRVVMIIMAGVLAVLVATIRSRRESALIRITDRVQRAILRPLPPELGGVAFASHYQSATRDAMVGGDLYDLTMTQFGPRFIIGDVKGKGLDAVGMCGAVLALFRELAFAEPDLIKLAEGMDARLSGDMGIEDFVTVILAEFGPGEVRLVNCGHHPPIKVGPNTGAAGLEIVAPEGCVPPLGLHPHPSRQDVAFKPGDRLLFYTDGLVETRDRAGRFLDLDGRVADALAAPALDSAVRGVAELLLGHAGQALTDDVLLVLGEPVAS